MASTSLRPNGTNASSSITWTNSALQAAWEQVDDDPNDTPALITADYVTNSAGGSASVTFALTNCPSDLASMDSVVITTYWTCVGYVDDGMDCYVQVLAADGVTALTTRVRIAGVAKGTGKTPDQGLRSTVAEVPTSTTKASWDGALLVVEWVLAGNMGIDGIAYQLGAVEVDGTYTASAGGPAQTVNPTGVTDSNALGSPTVTSMVTVQPTGLNATGSTGSPTVTPGPVTVSPTGLVDGGAIGSPSVSTGGTAQSVTPTGVAGAEALGSPTVSSTVTVSPTGLASASAVGSPSLVAAQTINPTGVPGLTSGGYGSATYGSATYGSSGSPIGSPTVTAGAGAVTVSPTGVSSAAAIGTPVVSAGTVVSPTGVATAGATGTPTVTPGAVTITPVGVADADAVGTPTVAAGGVVVSPTGVAGVGTTGTPVVTSQVTVQPTGLASGALIGTPALTGHLTISPTGVGSASAVGSPSTVNLNQIVSPRGVRDERIRPLDLVLVKGRVRLHLAGGIYV